MVIGAGRGLSWFGVGIQGKQENSGQNGAKIGKQS